MFNCVLCRFDQKKLIKFGTRDSDEFNAVECVNCGHVQLFPLPTQDDDIEFYNSDSQHKEYYRKLKMEVDEIRKKYMPSNLKQFERISKFINKSCTCIEIGAGYGNFIEIMEKNDYNCEGIEISEIRREIGQQFCKNKIHPLNLLKDDIPENLKNMYDVVFMFHVLEHVAFPEDFLLQAKQLLKNNGKIIIEVPNYNDHLLQICDPYFNFNFQRAHISYFKAETLTELVEKCGFKNIETIGVQTYSLDNLMNWINTGKPQFEKLNMELQEELRWIDDYYKNELNKNLKSNFIMVVADV